MIVTVALLTIIASLIVTFIWTTNNRYTYFKYRGIPGPPHRFFFGHYKTFWSTQSFSKLIQQWTQQYGSIYGLFAGRVPMYVVSDVNFLQGVYIKQFSSFHSRMISNILRVETDDRIHLFRATGSRWRRQRHVINPTFSAAKLKLMTPLVNGCIEALMVKVSHIVGSEEKEFNIYDLYKRLTMDVICRFAFGIETDMQNDVNNPYLQKAAEFFKVDFDVLPIVKIGDLVPLLARPMHDILFGIGDLVEFATKWMPSLSNYIQEHPAVWLSKRVQNVINLRAKSTVNSRKRVDLLQLMIDVSTGDKVIDHADERMMAKVLDTNEMLSNIFFS